MPKLCSNCHSSNPDGTKFCGECGTALARACPSCGAPATGKFCHECGAALLGARPTGPSLPVSERRTTTVLFGDLVGFTTLSESRDPEEVRELLTDYFTLARTVVSRYGGTIEKFIGDAVMAVWGVPISHEDDAERAVRAGRDLVTEIAALGATMGMPALQMRVGITTGSVAVTLGAVNEGMVAGDAVNTAARVQTAAEPGTVWTDQETRSLTAAAIAYSDMGQHTLKGKSEPVRLFRADAIVAAVGGVQRVDGLEAPLTGRDGEMRQIKDLFHATQADGKPRVVLVSGNPGVGKSRLGWELEKYIDGLSDSVRWHRGRSLSYGEGVSFWPFAEMVRSRLGIIDGENPRDLREKVYAGIGSLAADEAELAWLAPRIEALLGTWVGAPFERTDLFAAWTVFVDRVGCPDGIDQPVVLLFEDMQYADSGLLDLVEHILESSRAHVFVLLLTRPELLEQRPSLASGRRATVIDLQRLSDLDMVALVRGLVTDLPERALTAVSRRAEGVPLYAVEMVRSLIDRDVVIASDGRYVFADHDHHLVDLDQLEAPTSLHTLVGSRLDALTPLERRTVQDASVLGLVFRQTGLLALNDVSDYELDTVLTSLVRKGLFEVSGDFRSPERGHYRFLEAMVREVAYSTLARRDRRARHLAVADHLESEITTAPDLAGVIAQHLINALEASGEQDPDRPLLKMRARTILTASADRAESLGSPEEALKSTRSALALDPDEVETTELEERGARVATLAGANVVALELATKVHETFVASDDRHGCARALRIQASALTALGRHGEAVDRAEAGLALLEGDRAQMTLRLDLLRSLTGSLRFTRPEELPTRQLEMAREAEAHGDPEMLVHALNGLAIMLHTEGCPTAYIALLERCVSLSRGSHLLYGLGRSLANLGGEVYPRDLGQARELLGEALTVCRQVGDSYITEVAVQNSAFAAWLSGDWDEVETIMAGWLDGRPVTGTTALELVVLDLVVMARGRDPLSHGELPDSEDSYDQYAGVLLGALEGVAAGNASALPELVPAARHAYERRPMREDAEVLLPPAVDLLLRAGDLDGAEQLLALIAPTSDAQMRPALRCEILRLRAAIVSARGADPEALLGEAEQACQDYGAPFLLARVRLQLGRWLLSQGRSSEATACLAAARRGFVELGAALWVAEVDLLQPAQAGALV